MSLPWTTKLEIYRSDLEQDPYDQTFSSQFICEVDAHVSLQNGNEANGFETTYLKAITQVCDITNSDVAVDKSTGDRYEVKAAFKRVGLGIDHMQLSLVRVAP
jgi:hypothetical protein